MSRTCSDHEIVKGGSRPLLHTLLVATALSTVTAIPIPQASAQEAAAGIDEIVVTATRRAEVLSRVPISISAFDTSKLEEQNIKTVADLQRQLPTLQFSSGSNTIAIRGIVSSAGAATTGVYIDDTPIQLLNIGYGVSNALPRVFDLERVEVLNGPQGTLFGAGAMGGVLRFITAQPSLTEYSGKATTQVGFIEGGGNDYQVGFAFGGPIIPDRLGFRVSALKEYKGGWIDRLHTFDRTLIQSNWNEGSTTMVKMALLWSPVDELTITPQLLYQFDRSRPDTINPNISDLPNNEYKYTPTNNRNEKDHWYIPSLSMEYDFGPVIAISNTSGLIRQAKGSSDAAYMLGYTRCCNIGGQQFTTAQGYMLPVGFPGSYNLHADLGNEQKSFTQEIRLQSNDETSPLTWVLGGFYDKRTNTNYWYDYDPDGPRLFQYGVNPVTGGTYEEFYGVPLGNDSSRNFAWTRTINNSSYMQEWYVRTSDLAAFGEVSYNVTEELKLTVGARWTKNKFYNFSAIDGSINNGFLFDEASHNENAFTPKFNISYQADPDNLFYATVSKGYRVGGGNSRIPLTTCGPFLAELGISDAPNTYKSDTVWSYELGAKNRVLDNRVSLSSSVFYIEWTDLQQNISLPCSFSFKGNFGSAVSKGFDTIIDASITDDITLNGSVGYVDATYQETVKGDPNNATALAVVSKGDKLGVPRWKIAVGLQYDFEVADRPVFIRGDYQRQIQPSGFFVTDNPANSAYNANLRFRTPSRDYVTARAGIAIDNVDLSIFVDNLLDSSKLLSKSLTYRASPWPTGSSFRPRTFVLEARVSY